MSIVFYISAVVAIVATIMVITRSNMVHALLYLIVSLLAVAVIFFLLGAPFVAALEIIIYAGAIMVIFLFVIMLLNMNTGTTKRDKSWLKPGVWLGPTLLVLILAGELVYVFTRSYTHAAAGVVIGAKQVGMTLFGPYLLGVELVSMLLLAGLVGGFHIGRRDRSSSKEVSG